MPVKVGGLPAHVLLIHAVVVLLPLAAIMLVLSALWPAARRKLGFLSPAAALVGLILVPITTHAGEWLEQRLPHSAAIEKHAHLGDTLLPWAAGLFVVSLAVWLLGRRYDTSWRPGAVEPIVDDQVPSSGGRSATMTRTRVTATSAGATTRKALPVWVTAIVAVIAIGVSTGVSVQLYRIGDSGAKAVWGGVANLPAQGGGS